MGRVADFLPDALVEVASYGFGSGSGLSLHLLPAEGALPYESLIPLHRLLHLPTANRLGWEG